MQKIGTNMRIFKYVSFFMVFAVALIYIHQKYAPYRTFHGKIFGTYYHVKILTDRSDRTLGDKVIVSLAPRFGFLAVFYGYILPLLVMLITLLTVVFAGFSELIAGLSSIIVLIPYYFWLFLNRARFRQQFNFKISKQ